MRPGLTAGARVCPPTDQLFRTSETASTLHFGPVVNYNGQSLPVARDKQTPRGVTFFRTKGASNLSAAARMSQVPVKMRVGAGGS
jgi:hypothetical protein